MLAWVLALFSVVPGVITVDDDGPADFADVPAAVAAATGGETLLIWPGVSPSTATSKALALVDAVPGVKPRMLLEFKVDGAPTFTAEGIEFDELQVCNVAGRVRLDACDITGTSGWGEFGTCVVQACPDVVITRCKIDYLGHFALYSGHEALKIADSTAVLVDSTVMDPDGGDDPIAPDWGYEAIRTFGVVELRVIGCNLFGGNGGVGMSPADGVPPIVEWSRSLDLVIRGSSKPTGSGGNKANCVSVSGGYTWSGVQMISHQGVVPPPVSPAEPYLRIGGQGSGLRRLELYGSPGDTAVAVVSLGSAHFDLIGYAGDSVLLDPSLAVGSVTLPLLAQDTTATMLVQPPVSIQLVGLCLDVQALVWRPGVSSWRTRTSWCS